MNRPRLYLLLAAGLLSAPLASGAAAAAPALDATTVRTENYPRPPYSGATYYIYERGGSTICTKLEVCNKFNDCHTDYYKGVFKDPEDQQTGAPYGTTPAVGIPAAKLGKHACLAQYHLLGR